MSHRPELWKHILHELKDQLTFHEPHLPVALWITCSDKTILPLSLVEVVAELTSQIVGHICILPQSLISELPDFLCSSQLVLFLEQVGGSLITDSGLSELRNARLATTLPQHATLCLQLPQLADGVLRIDRYAGKKLLKGDQLVRPLLRHLDYSRSWLQSRQHLADSISPCGLSRHGWTIAINMAWALERSSKLMRRNHRELLFKAVLLVALILLVMPLIHQYTTRLLPDFILLVLGLLWLGQQQLHRCAQQWWCLAQALWIQDTWHRFGLIEDAASNLMPLTALDSGDDQGQLVDLLRSHQSILWLSNYQSEWSQVDIADLLSAVEQYLGRVRQSCFARQAHQRIAMLIAAGCMALACVRLTMFSSFLLAEAFMMMAIAAVVIFLDRPLPKAQGQRLIRHIRTLESEMLSLKAYLLDADRLNVNSRIAIVGNVHRIGIEVMDLANDSLELLASS